MNAEVRDVEIEQMAALDISNSVHTATNIQHQQTPSLGQVITETFTTKNGLKEYFNFIRKGFKL